MSEAQQIASFAQRLGVSASPASTAHGSLKGYGKPLPEWMQPTTITGFFYRTMLGQETEKEFAMNIAPSATLSLLMRLQESINF